MKKSNQVNYTASEARSNFYTLLKDASMGVATYEITNKYGEAAVLLSKDEYESWQETLDIMSRPSEYDTVLKAKDEKSTVSHVAMLKEIGIEESE